jgi:hypothetical protein
VRALLRSRAHRLLSDDLVLLSYEGHRSTRTFHVPLRYAELAGGRIVAMAVRPEGKLWWRSFSEPRDAVVLLRGVSLDARGLLAVGAVREEARAAYAARYPRSTGLLEDAALVVFERAG